MSEEKNRGTDSQKPAIKKEGTVTDFSFAEYARNRKKRIEKEKNRQEAVTIFAKQKRELIGLAAEFEVSDYTFTESIIFQMVRMNYEHFKRIDTDKFDEEKDIDLAGIYNKTMKAFDDLLLLIDIIEVGDLESEIKARKDFYKKLSDYIVCWRD